MLVSYRILRNGWAQAAAFTLPLSLSQDAEDLLAGVVVSGCGFLNP